MGASASPGTHLALSAEATFAWKEKAKCNESNQHYFFSEAAHDVREAKAICAACPVAEECLNYAQQTRINYYVFGGYTPSERKFLRRGKNFPPPITCPVCGLEFITHKKNQTYCSRECRLRYIPDKYRKASHDKPSKGLD